MHLHEDLVLLMLKERTEEALRRADPRRADRSAHRPLRVRLGMALIRLGSLLLGNDLPARSTDTGLRAPSR
jgi:hypothetical protein